MTNTASTILEKVKLKTRASGDCHLWQGNKNPCGYGVIRHQKRRQLLHRVIYELTIGPIPQGLVVMHTCDQRLCINPAHLRLGTIADNNRDMYQKGRNHQRAGELNAMAKLTARQVAEIRRRYKPYSKRDGASALASEFCVTTTTICAAASGKNWK